MKSAKTQALQKRRSQRHKPAVQSQHAAKTGKPASKAKPAHKAHKAPVKKTAAKAKTAHKRAWSAGVSCCSAEALAMSARLAGWPVGAEDVLDLYRLTADSPGAGASILATLDAAYTFGLAGVRPVSFQLLAPNVGSGTLGSNVPCILGLDMPEAPHAVTLDPSGGVWSWGGLYDMTAEAVIEEAWVVNWPRMGSVG